MKILVCVKQVPDTTEIRIDPVKNTLIREGVPSILNPYDGYALEAAARIRDQHPQTEIVALSMGPEQAKKVLKEAIAIAADRAYLLSDRAFGGADTLATSYTLSMAIRAIEEREGKFDAIFCGKQAIDGDTAQVGAEVAEYLEIPNISNVLSVDDYRDGKLFVTASLDEKIVTMSIALPCLISVDGDINTPRLPSYKIRKTLTDDSVSFLTFADFGDQNPDHYGLSGSATQVERIFPPEKVAQKFNIDGDADTQAQALFDLLGRKKML